MKDLAIKPNLIETLFSQSLVVYKYDVTMCCCSEPQIANDAIVDIYVAGIAP